MPESDRGDPGGGLERIVADRRAKAARLAALGRRPFANDFRPDALAADVLREAEALSAPGPGEAAAEPGPDAPRRAVAGRIVALRSFGKAAFLKLDDRSGRIQVQVRRDVLPEADFAAFRLAEPGDFVGVRGPVFRTKTGEATVLAERWVHLTKALRPPPEKWHGLTDVETRLRHRAVDLFANPEVRRLFRARGRIVTALREYLDGADFLEVETPMLHAIQGGAAARPFVTHHNALDLDLFLRIAPELYLKRLLVGGLERVYEIGRCFRNEGLSTRHNPEFTMLEFYEAYATCGTVMERTEELLEHVARRLDEAFPEFAARRAFRLERPFRRLAMPEALADRGVPAAAFADDAAMASYLERHHAGAREAWSGLDLGRRIYWLFETLVEPSLGPEPTFVVGYPSAVSPLARPRDDDPAWVDRFELFVGGQELANAFSELNDPDLQAERFRAQVEARRRGDEEAMGYDEEYVLALEHGMPPAGGFGLGVDRLVMLLCGVDSIREAILFPLRRPARENG
ncbi:MAG: lysine--tRNA ligase [Myxococcales bacterium]|nr:lysine--tRNA ligase [Myxococcales bacterium]